jgi:hypothetical protein
MRRSSKSKDGEDYWSRRATFSAYIYSSVGRSDLTEKVSSCVGSVSCVLHCMLRMGVLLDP